MPEKPRSPTDGKLSTVVQKKLVIIPPIAAIMLRMIGATIFVFSAIKQARDHVFGTHQVAEHGAFEWVIEIAPFGVASAFAIIVIAYPEAFATWALEIFNKAISRLVSWIPSKRNSRGN